MKALYAPVRGVSEAWKRRVRGVEEAWKRRGRAGAGRICQLVVLFFLLFAKSSGLLKEHVCLVLARFGYAQLSHKLHMLF
jgi:hypothetical protein